MKKALGVFLRFAVSACALAGIIYMLRSKLAEAYQILQTGVSWNYFILAIFVYLVALILLAKRIQFIFNVQSIHLKLREVFYLNFIGLFFNFFFPSAVGGDIAKAYYAAKHSGNKIGATTSVILDRLFGFVTIMFLALVAVTLFGERLDIPWIKPIIYSFWIVMAFCVVFFSSRRFAKKISFFKHALPLKKLTSVLTDIYHAIYAYRGHGFVLFACILISVIAQTLFISVYYLVALSLNVKVSFDIFFILVPVVTIASMVPSFGGIGFREGGAIYVLTRFMSSEHALAHSALVGLIIYGFSLAGGIVYAFGGGIKEEPLNELEEFNAQSS